MLHWGGLDRCKSIIKKNPLGQGPKGYVLVYILERLLVHGQ